MPASFLPAHYWYQYACIQDIQYSFLSKASFSKSRSPRKEPEKEPGGHRAASRHSGSAPDAAGHIPCQGVDNSAFGQYRGAKNVGRTAILHSGRVSSTGATRSTEEVWPSVLVWVDIKACSITRPPIPLTLLDESGARKLHLPSQRIRSRSVWKWRLRFSEPCLEC